MAIFKLFMQLGKGALFYYYNNPLRRFVKTDDKSAVGLSGSKQVHPHVLVFEEKTDRVDLAVTIKKKSQ